MMRKEFIPLYIYFGVILIINVPFIVCDFYFAQNGNCVDEPIKGFSFPMKTWLLVEGYMKLGICGLFLIALVPTCFIEKLQHCSQRAQNGLMILLGCAICIFIMYGIFMVAWLIVGAVMFWGELNDKDICSYDFRAYMYASLILGFINLCLSWCIEKKNDIMRGPIKTQI